MKTRLLMALLVGSIPLPLAAAPSPEEAAAPVLEVVTTVVPFPRGLAFVDGELYVLARGRVRDVGGVSADVDDRAGTIFRVDPNVTCAFEGDTISPAVRSNGKVLAEPTEPPFKLWDRSSNPPDADWNTDRPYCTLRYHRPTESFYICAFSGVDRAPGSTGGSFSKNPTDAILRYDLRTSKWYEVERHRSDAWHQYPHHDPAINPPPHGWLEGPDNCLTLGNTLYAVAKDNSVLVAYDLTALAKRPDAGPPPAELVMGEETTFADGTTATLLGQSGLAHSDGYLYISYRTTSEIIRIPLDSDFRPVQPVRAELVARFDPFDAATRKTPDLTDMTFDQQGRLYVVSAKPSRVFRFTPDPANVFDARNGGEAPWRDFAALTNNPDMKSENVKVHEGWLYITSGDGYGDIYNTGARGVVYRTPIQ